MLTLVAEATVLCLWKDVNPSSGGNRAVSVEGCEENVVMLSSDVGIVL